MHLELNLRDLSPEAWTSVRGREREKLNESHLGRLVRISENSFTFQDSELPPRMIYSCCSSSAGEDFVGILELAEGDFEIRTNDMTETTVGTEED